MDVKAKVMKNAHQGRHRKIRFILCESSVLVVLSVLKLFSALVQRARPVRVISPVFLSMRMRKANDASFRSFV